MEPRYHAELIHEALGPYLSLDDRRIIIRANIMQDFLGPVGHPEYHFDASRFADGVLYIKSQREKAVAALVGEGNRKAALQAFGRLLHACHDFYAHSNWVRLWVASQGGVEQCDPEDTPICEDPLSVPELQSGKGSVFWHIAYRLPLIGKHIKRFYLPPDSHEAMNLDHPGQGVLFAYAMAAARKHTVAEFAHLLRALHAAGGDEAVARFTGSAPERFYTLMMKEVGGFA